MDQGDDGNSLHAHWCQRKSRSGITLSSSLGRAAHLFVLLYDGHRRRLEKRGCWWERRQGMVTSAVAISIGGTGQINLDLPMQLG